MEALVNGSLPPEERILAEQHIATCEGCRLELELVRSIGSQERPPTAAKDDWTLDRIFGSDGQQGQGAEPGPSPEAPAPANPASPYPSTAPPSAFPTATPPSSFDSPSQAPAQAGSGDEKEENFFDEKGATGSTTSWDFEPADAKSGGGPPEESLFFATEALGRRNPRSKKKSALHLLLWGGGGLVGLILLGFSSWYLLHMSTPDSQDSRTGVDSPADSVPAGNPPATPDPSPEAPDDGGGAQPGGLPEIPDQTAQSVPPPQAPRVSASSAAPPQPIPVATPAPTPAPNPAPSQRPSKVPATSRGTAPPPKPAPGSQRASDSAGARVTPEPAQRSTRTVARPPDDEIPLGEESRPRETNPAPSVIVTESFEPVVDDPPDTPSRATGTRTPSPGTPAPSHQRVGAPPSKEPEPEPAPPPDNSPIGRLHQATVTAEAESDLVTLRNLRSEWKVFTSKIVGPDRARARREYADCLWAIQVLTGNRSDQKAALAAFREYLLSAPAGGADSRTVSRLRQLEDALTPGR